MFLSREIRKNAWNCLYLLWYVALSIDEYIPLMIPNTNKGEEHASDYIHLNYQWSITNFAIKFIWEWRQRSIYKGIHQSEFGTFQWAVWQGINFQIWVTDRIYKVCSSAHLSGNLFKSHTDFTVYVQTKGVFQSWPDVFKPGFGTDIS